MLIINLKIVSILMLDIKLLAHECFYALIKKQLSSSRKVCGLAGNHASKLMVYGNPKVTKDKT